MSSHPLPSLIPATDPKNRIASIDVLRGVAVLGILAINIWFFGFPFDVAINPYLWGDFYGIDNVAWWISWVGIEGSQRAIFTMLFGASVLLFTDRLSSDERAARLGCIYYRRTALLIAFGLINGYLLLWLGDILFFYGVAGLALFLVRSWKPRTLISVGLVVLVLLGLLNLAGNLSINRFQPIVEVAQQKLDEGQQLTAEEQIAVDVMAAMPLQPATYDELKEEVDTRSAGYLSAFIPNANSTTENYIVFGLFSLIWESFAYMMIGMALFRLRVFDASRSTKLYSSMCFLGFALGISINVWEQMWSIENEYRSTFAIWTYDIGRMATAFGYIGMIMVICKLGWLQRLQDRLAAVGKMALSNYIAQSIFCNVIFIGFGQFGQLRFHELYFSVIAFWVFMLIASPIWLKHYRYGPLEWFWRRATYGQQVPMRLESSPNS